MGESTSIFYFSIFFYFLLVGTIALGAAWWTFACK